MTPFGLRMSDVDHLYFKEKQSIIMMDKLNISTLRRSKDYIRVYIDINSCDILALQETWHLDNNIDCLVPFIRPRNVPFRRRYNLKKAKWQSYAKEVDNGISNTNPVPENYEKFVNLVRRSSNKNITRGCLRVIYVA